MSKRQVDIYPIHNKVTTPFLSGGQRFLVHVDGENRVEITEGDWRSARRVSIESAADIDRLIQALQEAREDMVLTDV